jgi:hypothetical protein
MIVLDLVQLLFLIRHISCESFLLLFLAIVHVGTYLLFNKGHKI